LLLLLPGLFEDSNTDSDDGDKEDSDGKLDDKDDSLDDDTDIKLGLFGGEGKDNGINSDFDDVDGVASDDNVRLEDANCAPDIALASLLDKDDAVEVFGKEAHASPKITDVSLSPKLFPFMISLC
jgi:hypothetical protein